MKNTPQEEIKKYKPFIKRYFLIILILLTIIICSFLIWKLVFGNSKTKTISDKRTEYIGERSDILDDGTTYLAFKDHHDNDPKNIYYLLPEDQLSLYPIATSHNEGKSFIISGDIIHIKEDDSSIYWELVDGINILALVEYNGILTYPQSDNENIEYYSFKACSQEYSNCKYYLLNAENLSESQLDLINSLNENDEVKLSGKENELEGAAGSIYIELIEEIDINLHSD